MKIRIILIIIIDIETQIETYSTNYRIFIILTVMVWKKGTMSLINFEKYNFANGCVRKIYKIFMHK
jgi:hypothetical protein